MAKVTVTCDACGAAIPAESACPIVTCEYCGTSARNPLYIGPKPEPPEPFVPSPPPVFVTGQSKAREDGAKIATAMIFVAIAVFIIIVLFSLASEFDNFGFNDFGGYVYYLDGFAEDEWQPEEEGEWPGGEEITEDAFTAEDGQTERPEEAESLT